MKLNEKLTCKLVVSCFEDLRRFSDISAYRKLEAGDYQFQKS